jgi:hypothetical protein
MFAVPTNADILSNLPVSFNFTEPERLRVSAVVTIVNLISIPKAEVQVCVAVAYSKLVVHRTIICTLSSRRVLARGAEADPLDSYSRRLDHPSSLRYQFHVS